MPWWIIWLVGAGLQMARIETGWVVVDEFALRFIHFYSGYVVAPYVFRFAALVLRHGWLPVAYLLVWGIIEGFAVFGGVSEVPGIGLALGFVGAIAVVTLSTLLSKSDLMAPVCYCGRNSIIIYLAFFLPMAAARQTLIKTGVVPDIGTMSVVITAAGVIFPLVLFWTVRGSWAGSLFARPGWTRLQLARPALVPAE